MASNKALADPIHSSTLGEELSPQECEILATKFNARKLKDGELLVAAGGSAKTLFLLTDGKLAVINADGPEEKTIYTMKPGEVAGTRAFVDRRPRNATLRAVGTATVYTLEPDSFESLLDTHPRIVYKVMRALFRITHTNLMRMNLETAELANYISRTHGRY